MTIEEKITKKFLSYYNVTLFVVIVAAMLIVHLLNFEFPWAVYIGNLMFFAFYGKESIKATLLKVEIGGTVGMILTALSFVGINILTPMVGGTLGFILPMAAYMFLVLIVGGYLPTVFNSTGFAILCCAGVNPGAFMEKFPVCIAGFVVGSLLLNGISILLMKPVQDLAVKSVTKAEGQSR